MDKLELALHVSEEILTGIETDSLSTSTIAMRCLRLARLLSDVPAIEWFLYETGGYTQTPNGMLETNAFEVASAHGREVFPTKEGQRKVFTALANELETNINAMQNAMGSLTTQGISLAGDYLTTAMNKLLENVSMQTNAYLRNINQAQHNLTILRGRYYDYALSVNLELKFSERAEEVFRSYRLSVDKLLAKLAPNSLKKLDAAYERLSSENPESWAQAVTSCRRVLQEVSDAMFVGFKNNKFTTKSGKVLDVSGEHYLNRLFASIDILASSPTARRLVGSNVLYVVDLVDNLHDALNRGVHDLNNKLTYEEARATILHTYILLGDISTLNNDTQQDDIATK